MSETVRVFVSHHHSPEEDAFTARLVADLEAAGADVWVDTKGISSGSFVQKISEGLAGRQWLVLVMTPAALMSEWVQDEVNAALHQVHGKRMLGVIPLVMTACDEALIPALWAHLHRYDAARDYATGRDGLLRAMGLSPLPVERPATHQPGPVGPAQPQRQPVGRTPIDLPLDRLSPRLKQLGFAVYRPGDTQYILPPLCDVPTGAFLMGSDLNKDSDANKDRELPQHKVTLTAFLISKYPVTVAEYACFVRAGQKEPSTWQQLLGKLDHPVVYVNWQDAVAYAKWLAQRTGRPWRLPSEAEWEKAARGTDARIYPWGTDWDPAKANTSEGKNGSTTPVGSYPNGGSPFGALDMAGNVWEWTSTIVKSYPYVATDGREQAESTGNRVLRGGSWGGSAWYARAACRDLDPPDDVRDDLGFRVVCAVPSE